MDYLTLGGANFHKFNLPFCLCCLETVWIGPYIEADYILKCLLHVSIELMYLSLTLTMDQIPMSNVGGSARRDDQAENYHPLKCMLVLRIDWNCSVWLIERLTVRFVGPTSIPLVCDVLIFLKDIQCVWNKTDWAHRLEVGCKRLAEVIGWY